MDNESSDILSSTSQWEEYLMQREVPLHNLAQNSLRLRLPSASSFEPHLMFFYGTLSLPHTLSDLLDLPASSALKPARIRGYCIKMWGPYPALVKAQSPTDNDVGALTYGMAYTITDEKDLQRLKQYEGENYKLSSCVISLEGEPLRAGWTFLWNGYPEDLADGNFEPYKFPANVL